MEAIDKPIEYIPIDISKEFLFKNARDSAKDFPDLKIKAICADFNQIDVLQKIIGKEKSKNWFFPWLYSWKLQSGRCKKITKKFSKILENESFLVIGVDLKKDIDVLEKAYNDSEGVTAEFNKNILNGVNKIFGTIFDSTLFSHELSSMKRKVE